MCVTYLIIKSKEVINSGFSKVLIFAKHKKILIYNVHACCVDQDFIQKRWDRGPLLFPWYEDRGGIEGPFCLQGYGDRDLFSVQRLCEFNRFIFSRGKLPLPPHLPRPIYGICTFTKNKPQGLISYL